MILTGLPLDLRQHRPGCPPYAVWMSKRETIAALRELHKHPSTSIRRRFATSTRPLSRQSSARNRRSPTVTEKAVPVLPPYISLMVGDREEDRLCAERAGLDFQLAAEWRAEADRA